MEITPFRVQFPESDLDDLRERLRRTRWPDAQTVDDWTQGVPLDYLRDLCEYWWQHYDWRAAQDRLNEFPQFRTEIDGLGIHFLHARSPRPDALPVVLTHGWPGSVLEFLKVVGPLTDPPNAADAFHVVCPSLPGFGFGDRPTERGWSVRRVARAWMELMARLGYERYGAVGGDWGSTITTIIGQQDCEHLAGIHLLPPLVAPDPATMNDLTDQERAALADLKATGESGTGFAAQMSTRPQTLGYGLADSPAGLCAWLVEKLVTWSGSTLTRDEILDNVTLYWLTGTAVSAARLHWESFGDVRAALAPGADTVSVATGCSIFPHETVRPSRRWAEQRFLDIRYWNEAARGGHFAAWEEPALFADEVRAFFRLVR
jgi:pimeloyl-ACP methyl ester carboxylesterase